MTLICFYCLQITNHGEPICDFGMAFQKQPFEKVFIACHVDSDDRIFDHIEREKFIFSVPSAIHSHKPPLVGWCLSALRTFHL